MGDGFTIIENKTLAPKQRPLPTEAEREMIAGIGVSPVFVATNDGILPLPLEPKPIK